METLPMIPKDQLICKSHAASMLMIFTERHFKDLVLHIYERAKKNQERWLYYNLVNILLYRVTNEWVDQMEAVEMDATLIREMSVSDQEEYVRVYENRYSHWLRYGVLMP